MPKEIKIVAVTNAEDWRWSVLVEINRETLAHLVGNKHVEADPPRVGSVFSMDDMIRRLANIEIREQKMEQFAKLLAGFMPEPEESKPE